MSVVNPTGKHVSRMSRDDMLMFLDANRNLLPDVWVSPQDDDDIRRHVDYILSHIPPISESQSRYHEHDFYNRTHINSESHLPNSSIPRSRDHERDFYNRTSSIQNFDSLNSVRYDESFMRFVGAICRCSLPDPAPGEKSRRVAFSKQLNTLIDPIKVVIRILCDSKINVDDAVSICSPLTRRIVDLSISIAIGDGRWNHVSEIRHKTVDRVDHAIREWFASITYCHCTRTYDSIKPLGDVLALTTRQLIDECQSVLEKPRHPTYRDIVAEEMRMAEQHTRFGPIRRNQPYSFTSL